MQLPSILVGVFTVTMVTINAARGQTPTADRPAERQVVAYGEVTTNDVYVRSGPSLNHYTICKLNAGDRVAILGETSEWFEIRPPESTFSLISGDYVDTADEKKGVVNGTNVRVRAGSLLNDNKYTVQTMLSTGAEVTILGRNPDGFLRIVPPPGATFWITRQFVEPIPDALLSAEEAAGRPTTTAVGSRPADKPGASTTDASAGSASAAETGGDTLIRSALAALPRTPQRKTLEKIDADTRTEFKKPILERRLEPLIERYQPVASQNDDEMARRYAEARIRQLNDAISLIGTVRQLRRLGDQAESTRREFLEARAKIPTAALSIPAALDAQGQLRVSALYPPGSVPRRYRLVDNSGPTDRTVAYVEIPSDVQLDVDQYLGRLVGVRAAEKRWQKGAVDPIPIYVVKELVALVDGTEETETAEEPAPSQTEPQKANGG